MSPVLTADERKTLLARAVQEQLRYGGHVESTSDYQAVLVFGEPVNHILHFLIGIFTLGVWWIAWLLMILTNKRTRRSIYVDELGAIQTQDVRFQ